MWVITIFIDDRNTIMYELDTEEEARIAFKEKKGCKILSELVYQPNHDILVTT